MKRIPSFRIMVMALVVGMIIGLVGPVVVATEPTTLVIGLTGDPKSIGPTGTNNDACVAYRVYSSLTQLDKNGMPAPDLAQSWEVSSDSLTYTFHLNPMAKFHDGTPVTSEDVKFSILEVANALVSHATQGLIPSIDSIETPDEHTVVFHLSRVFPEIFDGRYGLGPRCSMVLKKADWEGTDYFTNPFNLKPIGSGPFKFVEWVKGSHIVLERWDNYWGEKTEIEKVVFRVITDPTAMSLSFENGEVDYVPHAIVSSDVERLNSLPGKEALFHGTMCGDTVSVRFNLRKEMFQDITLRRAFAYAINRERIPGLVYYGGATATPGYVNRTAFSAWWYNPHAIQAPYDPEMAKTLLDKAGYPVGADGWRFHTTIVYGTNFPEDAYVAELVKADLANVEIDAKLISLDYAAWVDSTFVNWDFDLTLSSTCTGPAPTALGRYTSSNIIPVAWANDMGFSNFEYDELFKRQGAEPDKEKRLAYLYRMQEIMVEQEPGVFLVQRGAASAWNSGKFVAEPEELWKEGLGYYMMHLTGVRPAR
ncbi:MAG TPA: ABC transporter substrate-binding protein [Candidatus Heimdallarchaeota archaeon]|nr:ABC transporter substrate-binding protein [Candidatus Heimdallarchaeota archaeon]